MIPFGFFSSSQIPFDQPVQGMSIWLKSDTQVLNESNNQCVDGDAVFIWRDQSGKHNDFVYSSSPTYHTNQLNSYPSVNFNGSANQMYSVNKVTPKYVFFVVNVASIQNSYSWNVLIGLKDAGDSGYIARLQNGNSSLWDNDWNGVCGVGRANGVDIGGYSTNNNTVTNDVFTQYTSGPNLGYADPIVTGYLAIGLTNNRAIKASVVEILVYENNLNTNQISHNENYLISKYGIAAITGSYIWLNAAKGAYNGNNNLCSDGDYVFYWNDQSGNSNNAVTPYSYPVYKSISQNSLPSIKFTGEFNQGMSVGLTRSYPETQFYVCYDDASDTGDRTVADGDQNQRRLLSHHNGNEDFPNWSLFYGGGGISNTSAPQGTWSIITVLQNGSQSSFRVNGNAVACDIGNSSSAQFVIGNDGGFVTGLVGYISESILYPKTLSLSEIHLVEQYLSVKYNISVFPLPPDFSNLIRWWEPSTGFDGSNWYDKIYNIGMVGSASTGTLGKNVKNAIYCNTNLGNGLVDSTNYSGINISVYYVAKPNSSPSGRILQSTVNNWLVGWWNDRQGAFFFDGGGSWLGNGPSDGHPHIYAMNTNRAFANCYGNGQLIFSGTDGVTPPNGLCIGNSGLRFSNESCSCTVGDILIYNVAHDETTAKKVMAWLNSKYGVY